MNRFTLAGVCAVAVAWAAAADARAAHCGACRYPGPCVSPAQCAPVVTSTVCYQPVDEQHCEVRYRPVYKTVCQPETYTTCKPVYETHCEAVPYTVNRFVTEHFDTVQCYTVNRPVYETHTQEQRYTVN